MMRDTPNWVNYEDMPSSIFFTSHHQHSSSSSSVTSSQQSWPQQLDSFSGKDDDGYRITTDNQYKKMSTWYDPNFSSTTKPNADAHNREVFHGSNLYPRFPLKSCQGEDMLDFSNNKSFDFGSKRQPSEKGGKCKKVKAISPPQPPLKVRKEKLGDRITALHQLVSPFGKTDTASVLLEAIGYIRFLQGQIEALSSPYVRKPKSQQYSLEDEEGDDGGGLRGRGLCLVPIPYTGETGEDYWCSSIGAGEGGCF